MSYMIFDKPRTCRKLHYQRSLRTVASICYSIIDDTTREDFFLIVTQNLRFKLLPGERDNKIF